MARPSPLQDGHHDGGFAEIERLRLGRRRALGLLVTAGGAALVNGCDGGESSAATPVTVTPTPFRAASASRAACSTLISIPGRMGLLLRFSKSCFNLPTVQRATIAAKCDVQDRHLVFIIMAVPFSGSAIFVEIFFLALDARFHMIQYRPAIILVPQINGKAPVHQRFHRNAGVQGINHHGFDLAETVGTEKLALRRRIGAGCDHRRANFFPGLLAR